MALVHEAPRPAHLPGAGAAPPASRILAYVDSEEAGEAIVAWLRECTTREPVAEILLLAVLPRPNEVRTRGIMADTVRKHLMEAGQRRLAGAEQALAEAGMRSQSRVELDDETEAILRHAREVGCRMIALAGKPPAVIPRWLAAAGLGGCSLGARIADLADVPVLILKGRAH